VSNTNSIDGFLTERLSTGSPAKTRVESYWNQ